MRDNVKVAVWGFGAMGRGIVEMILKKKGIEIIGVCDINPAIVGKDIHEVLGVERKGAEVFIKDDIKEIVKAGNCDIALLATDSFTKNAFDKIKYCLEQKVNVISTAEEFAYPQQQSPELTKQLDKIAKANGVTALGTGINPGFVLDYLILALTGTCETVDHIKAARVNDLSPFGHAVMEEQGVGITQDEFKRRIAEDSLAGHVGFPESIAMVAAGLGVKLEKVTQTQDPIVSNVARETKYAKVEPGNLAGIRQQGFGYVDGKVYIEMDHPQQILPHLENQGTGDYIWIKGVPDISMEIKPEIPGGIGTISMVVNMIPQTINAAPGVVTMLDLPVPRAIMGDFRDFIK
jgi:4-hydroxy-tetrahydrodipicolinate reductase